MEVGIQQYFSNIIAKCWVNVSDAGDLLEKRLDKMRIPYFVQALPGSQSYFCITLVLETDHDNQFCPTERQIEANREIFRELLANGYYQIVDVDYAAEHPAYYINKHTA